VLVCIDSPTYLRWTQTLQTPGPQTPGPTCDCLTMNNIITLCIRPDSNDVECLMRKVLRYSSVLENVKSSLQLTGHTGLDAREPSDTDLMVSLRRHDQRDSAQHTLYSDRVRRILWLRVQHSLDLICRACCVYVDRRLDINTASAVRREWMFWFCTGVPTSDLHPRLSQAVSIMTLRAQIHPHLTTQQCTVRIHKVELYGQGTTCPNKKFQRRVASATCAARRLVAAAQTLAGPAKDQPHWTILLTNFMRGWQHAPRVMSVRTGWDSDNDTGSVFGPSTYVPPACTKRQSDSSGTDDPKRQRHRRRDQSGRDARRTDRSRGVMYPRGQRTWPGVSAYSTAQPTARARSGQAGEDELPDHVVIVVRKPIRINRTPVGARPVTGQVETGPLPASSSSARPQPASLPAHASVGSPPAMSVGSIEASRNSDSVGASLAPAGLLQASRPEPASLPAPASVESQPLVDPVATVRDADTASDHDDGSSDNHTEIISDDDDDDDADPRHPASPTGRLRRSPRLLSSSSSSSSTSRSSSSPSST
jgi:hypothetical protein